jgi:SAM-dependent methyltransferase
MDSRRILHFATHPVYALRRVSYRIYESFHPDEPWIAQGAVRFCEQRLRSSMRAVETGSGRSTAWFARRVGHLLSVEHDERWFETVKEKLRGLSNVDYRLIPLDHPPDEPTRPSYDPLPRYVAALSELGDATLDLAVIDGHYRQACLLAVFPKLKPGGLLLLDNSDWLSQDEWGVPHAWPLVHRSSNVMTTTSIWEKPKSPD